MKVWEGHSSESFMNKNGVRQGAVLSPILFNLFTAELFKILEAEGYGASINGNFHGIFEYADNIDFLSNPLEGILHLLNSTSKYAISHDITFSTNMNMVKLKTK